MRHVQQFLRRGVSAVALAALAALSACTDSSSSSDGDPGGPAQLDLAIPSAVIAPKEEVATYAVGDAEGYLSAEKLKVNVINTDGSVAAVQAVASGSADIAPADAGAILAAREKGVPVKAVGGLVRNWPWRMAVQPDSDIKTAADLEGKKVGVISLASGSAIYARAYAADAGLDAAKDVDLLPVGVGAQALSALESGKVDVLALYTQAFTTIENTGTEFRYLDNSAAFDGIRSLTFAVTEKTLKEKKDVLTRYLRASYKALLFSAVNPEAAMRDGYRAFPQLLTGKKADDRIGDDTKTLQAWIKTAVPASGEPASFKDWGAISDAEWSRTVAYTTTSGQITKDVSLPQLWDDSLLNGANDFDSAAVVEKAKAADQ
ncbi:ABC transporter substrate-binding protein [Streptomyces sp. ME18-1-4]|uniref:ABC transporter substrate-binding protein n=1 Tax=Streptomyces sp. ME18-1-4 TaxID=3028685 RepID=UPI0029B560DF|nr:ABC transporter substrate-binding protein [Streptomyces sp. ME18-1-4]MDX3243370.1 ABC transporter substrate-binding protein [Streptomyces sp. ME18-1-4]